VTIENTFKISELFGAAVQAFWLMSVPESLCFWAM
jgi:hypothetical protein